MTFKIPRGKIAYNTNDARTHASYMLSSTIRRTTQHLYVIPYAMYPPPNMESLFEANFSQNSTKTIRLFALDFYEVIVDSAFGIINYHLIEISSS